MSYLQNLMVLFMLPTLVLPVVAQAVSDLEHHPDIEIQLFASEPDVVDPVALDFAADGSCFVVEMRDYPYGFGDQRRPGGTIRLLRDTDDDGRADQSVLFAEDLSFPTSVMAWKQGVLVVAPPQVIYLEDTDGDDRSDLRRVMIDGLVRGVTDSNANSLRFGFDNRVHLANGGNAGQVSLPGRPTKSVTLGRADLSADFDAEILSRTRGTGGGFGLLFDAWDNRFTTYNIDYLQQQVLPLELLESRPDLPRWEVTHNVSDHGPSARIFPIVKAQTRVNHPEQAGHFSSAGGMGLIPAGTIFKTLGNSIFVCDVVCNLVHRDVLYEKGPIFGARRAPEETDREFIASRDPDFRPVGLEHGPDGALYLMDMQRSVIEHPDYIPEKVLAKMDYREGENRGRIYRIIPRERSKLPPQQLANMAEEGLVKSLASIHPWVRRTAQRLIWEQRTDTTAATVRKHGLNSESPEALVRSLWLLEGMGQLREAELLVSLVDSSHGVRQNAVRLVARHPEQWPEADKASLDRLQDDHPHVRYWAAIASRHAVIREKLQPLAEMLMKDQRYEWSRRAVYVGAKGGSLPLLALIVDDAESAQPNEERRLVIRELAAVVAAGLTEQDRREFVSWIKKNSKMAPWETQQEVLHGLLVGWQRRPESRLPSSVWKPLLDDWRPDSRDLDLPLFDLYRQADLKAPAVLVARLEQATLLADKVSAELPQRLAAIEVLARLPGTTVTDRLARLLESNQQSQIQLAALASLESRREPSTARTIVKNWTQLRPANRTKAINILLSRRDFQSALLSAVEQAEIDVSELNLDLEQRRTLLRWSTPKIAKRAAEFWGDEEYSNRKQIVSQWLDLLPPDGDSRHGKEMFVKHCANCHRVHELGSRVGPELTAQSHRSVEDLLSHILDPNMAINPNYVTCVVETVDGQVMQGLLADEDINGITLVQAENRRTTIPRQQIEQLQMLKTSLMPEGLEKQLSPADLRSLISFLQQK